MKKTLNFCKTKLLFTAFLLTNIALIAQSNQEISGKITSSTDNAPIPGVNVIVVGTSNGTTTDFDGNYQINAPEGSKISFSFLGFVTKTISVSNQTTLNISLEEDSNELDEVVVVGYGARKKSDITGSVSSVKSEELNAFPVADASQALQGRAAGVVVQSNNGGEPGAPISIKIRGNTSISASSSPLVVVDGFVGGTMPQAADIQSMEVLKDASATAIYGSRGSNGVILVTTKKGRQGKITVELNSSYSVQNTANKLDLLNAEDFVTYQQQIRTNNGNNTPYNDSGFDTDWQDLIYRTGNTQNHTLSFSGGTAKSNFYASGNYYKQDGVLINSGFEKATFLSNLDAQVTSKLKLGLNLYGSKSTKKGVATQSTGANGVGGGGDDAISLAMRFDPTKDITDTDGNFSTNDQIGDPVDNPYAVASQRTDNTKEDEFRANAYLEYEIIEDLTFKTTFGLSTRNTMQGIYVPSTLIVSASAVSGRASVENWKRSTALTENYLTYNKEIGKGKLTALAGFSYQRNLTERSLAQGTGFISDSFLYYGLESSTGFLQPESQYTEVEIQSVFGRLNYDLNDKYLITATVRRDGASNFSENYKYATFPSAALGWKISNEEFLKENKTISNLKLRASYGLTGNPSIAAYQSLALLSTLYASSEGETVPAVTAEQPANENLKWETSYQTNIGVDFGFLNNNINLSVDYYTIDTKDLILPNSGIPAYAGYLNDEILGNLGEINNSGFEISINTRNISNENFRWTTDFNISANKSKVLKLVNDADFFDDGTPSYFSHDRSTIMRVGEEVGLFWGLEYAGVKNGATPDGMAGRTGTTVDGDPLFVDIDGDGAITDEDRTIIGNPNADFNWGFTNNFVYKDFDLNIFFQGSSGGEIMNLTNVQLTNGDSNTTQDYFNNAWTPTNTNTDQPRVGNNSNREISSRFVEDGSYIRLKNIALGYNLPRNVYEKIGIENIRLAVSAQNLLTFTKYSGLDPEVNFFGSAGNNNQSTNTVNGFDFGNYPTVKSVTFSLNLKF
ncbi:TonB-dependent receptor [Flavicella sp.]|uniref:SusC/RagA family TonB-linked outer membrane protein n=1 Tax=Flavicella sp. TaxID=2957742 RepID=UPI002615ECB0|nr:TonB-dependent receptor [Flavicella sp.]MDG1805779.1 TonB-dependent receptor [Flavicella sp.]